MSKQSTDTNKNNYTKLNDNTYSLKVFSKKHGSFLGFIDSSCLEKCQKFTWNINKQASRFVLIAYVPGSYPVNKFIYLHRLVTDSQYNMVDHINGNPLDNRLSNLRPSTPSNNQANRRNHVKRIGLLEGVTREKKKFGARLIYKNSPVYIGTFNTEIEAHNAYVTKHKELFKEHSKWCTL